MKNKNILISYKERMRIVAILVLVFMTSVFNAKAFATVHLPIQRQVQETSMWCWAACSQTILVRHTTWIEQCAMADWLFNETNCCTTPTPNDCVGGATNTEVRAILEHYYIDSTARTRSLSKNECWTEFAAGRPFVIFWDWDDSGAHFIVGVGMSDDKNTLYWMDPWTGSSGGYWQSGYDWVVDGDNHRWTQTVETDENPGSAVILQHTFDDDGWKYETSGIISSFDFEVRDQGGSTTEFIAGDYIYLGTGFEVKNGAQFEATLE